MDYLITTTDSKAFSSLTPERWAAARAILCGESDTQISKAAAAAAAGIPIHHFTMWIKRSREKRPEDELWVWEIAEVFDASQELKAGRLEDVAWERAVTGWEEPVYQGGELVGHRTKTDNALLMKMLKRHAPEYQDQAKTQVNAVILSASEVYQRLFHQNRIEQIEGGNPQ